MLAVVRIFDMQVNGIGLKRTVIIRGTRHLKTNRTTESLLSLNFIFVAELHYCLLLEGIPWGGGGGGLLNYLNIQ
jgi:hypothetical protein